MDKNRITRRASPQRKRFLINAAILAALGVFIALRLPSWGIAQVIVIALIAALAGMQLLFYFKLK